MAGVIGWMPPEWAVPLLLAKGALAALGVVLLVMHMDREWGRMRGPQRARYLLLLGYAVLASGSTAEQVSEGVQLSYRHLASLALSASLVAVAVWSIRASRIS